MIHTGQMTSSSTTINRISADVSHIAVRAEDHMQSTRTTGTGRAHLTEIVTGRVGLRLKDLSIRAVKLYAMWHRLTDGGAKHWTKLAPVEEICGQRENLSEVPLHRRRCGHERSFKIAFVSNKKCSFISQYAKRHLEPDKTGDGRQEQKTN